MRDYSYEDYLDIDTKERVELIFGDIYMMAGASASHQDAVLNLGYSLKNISKTKEKCLPRIAPFDLKLKNGDDISVPIPPIQKQLSLMQIEKYCKNRVPLHAQHQVQSKYKFEKNTIMLIKSRIK